MLSSSCIDTATYDPVDRAELACIAGGAPLHIHELAIENFRGIRFFKEKFHPGVNAIIGAGDSGKTTILDALTVLFHPTWALSLTDNDFYAGDPGANPIRITATVADPPTALTSDQAFFAYLRGITPDGEIVDEPDDHIPALTCELTVGDDFEPTWRVVCDRHEDGATLSANRRQQFGVRRIDASDHHLKWTRFSALHHLSDESAGQSSDAVLRAVTREARTTARGQLTPFTRTVSSIAEAAKLLRAAPADSEFSADLDADLTALTRGSISLHMDDRPVRRAGLGSRRLVTVGVQTLAEAGAHTLLIDEFEAGLEPHRTRHLIRYLQRETTRQVLLTTHSPTVIRELVFNQLHIARRQIDRPLHAAAAQSESEGTEETTTCGAIRTLTLTTPDESVQGTIRTHADGFLAPRVLICEGATEIGFIRELCNQLEDTNPNRVSLIATVDGGGDPRFIPHALAFQSLGYDVGLFCDHDKDTDLTAIQNAGIHIMRTDPGLCLEQHVLAHLTKEGVGSVIQYGITQTCSNDVRSALMNSGIDKHVASALTNSTHDMIDRELISKIATVANKAGWFKQISRGEDLARIVLDPNQTTMSPQLESYLNTLRDWCAPA